MDKADELRAVQALIYQSARIAAMVTVEQANEVLTEIGRVESFLPFTDPTAYMRIRDTLPGHQKAVRAFLAFRKALEDVKDLDASYGVAP